MVAGALAPLLFDTYNIGAAGGLTLAFWILFATSRTVADRLISRAAVAGGFGGMVLAHSGVAIFVIGVTLTSIYGQQRDVLLVAGERQALGSYAFELIDLQQQDGENYTATIADLQVWRGEEKVVLLHPEKRRYHARPENLMTEAGIVATWHGDLYASLGERRESGVWSGRLQYKPFVRFIWGGALLMALGGIVAAADRRYRRGT